MKSKININDYTDSEINYRSLDEGVQTELEVEAVGLFIRRFDDGQVHAFVTATRTDPETLFETEAIVPISNEVYLVMHKAFEMLAQDLQQTVEGEDADEY